MYKQCTTEITTARQRKLEQCLLEFLKSCSYDHITVGDICAAANVPRGMFYRYFDSKKDALDALIDHTLLDFITSVIFSRTSGFGDPLGMKAVLNYWKSQEPLLEALTKNRKEALLFERSIICCTQDANLLAPYLATAGQPTEPEVIAFCINGVISTILIWHRSGYAKSTEEMADILQKLLTGPIVTAAEPR